MKKIEDLQALISSMHSKSWWHINLSMNCRKIGEDALFSIVDPGAKRSREIEDSQE